MPQNALYQQQPVPDFMGGYGRGLQMRAIEDQNANQNALAPSRQQAQEQEVQMNAMRIGEAQRTISQRPQAEKRAALERVYGEYEAPLTMLIRTHAQKMKETGNKEMADATVRDSYATLMEDYKRNPDVLALGITPAPTFDPVLAAKGMKKISELLGKPEGSGGQSYDFLNTEGGYSVGDKRTGKMTKATYEGTNERPIGVSASIELAGRKKEATDRASAGVKKEVGFPKARSTFNSLNRQWDLVGTQIDKAISEIGPFTAGLGAWASVIPASPQKDLAQTLETIKANIGFDKLADMRANSPTGGALGQVTDFENKLLQAVYGSLQQNQSPAQLKANLQTVKDMLMQVREERTQAFSQDYGDIAAGKRDLSAPPVNRQAPVGAAPMTATNPNTGQKIKSLDGGKTWQAM